MSEVFGLYNYWIVIFLMMTGFYIVISRGNLVKDLLETPTGRYLAEVARHQLGAELDPANPLPNQRVILMPAYNGDRLSVILRVYW